LEYASRKLRSHDKNYNDILLFCSKNNRKYQVCVSINSLDDLVLEDLMKVHEVIALEHVGTMLTLMKMWRFDFSCVDQALCACSLSRLFMGKTSLKNCILVVDHFA